MVVKRRRSALWKKPKQTVGNYRSLFSFFFFIFTSLNPSIRQRRAGGPLRAASVSELLRARHGDVFRLPCARGRFTRLNRVLWRTRRRSALPNRPSTRHGVTCYYYVTLRYGTIDSSAGETHARGACAARQQVHATGVEAPFLFRARPPVRPFRKWGGDAGWRPHVPSTTQEFFYLEPAGRPPFLPSPLTLEWNHRNRSVSSLRPTVAPGFREINERTTFTISIFYWQ